MDRVFNRGAGQASWDTLFDTSPLEKPVRAHLKNVYSCLAIAMLAAAAGGYIHVVTNILQGGFLTMLVSLGLLIALGATPNTTVYNQSLRLALLTGFAFFTGLGMGPLLDAVIRIDPSIVPTAFLATCVVFVCFTAAAMFTEQRKFLYLGGMLMSAVSFMLLMSVINLFVQSRMLFDLQLYGGLAVFCAFVLYDTQLIIEKRRRGDRDYIWHCVDLFIDFIAIFKRIMIILAFRLRQVVLSFDNPASKCHTGDIYVTTLCQS